MADIRDFDQLERLEEWVLDNWRIIQESIAETTQISLDDIERLQVQELIIAGEHGRGTGRTGPFPLRLAFVIDVEGEVASESDLYRNFIPTIPNVFSDPDFRDDLEGFEPPFDGLEDEFERITSTSIPSDRLEEGIRSIITLRDDEPNRLYSLTRDQDIIVTEDTISRQPSGTRAELQEEPDVEVRSITQYPDLRELSNSIISAFSVARDGTAESYDEVSEDISNLTVTNIVETGPWGKGVADKGEDAFEFSIFIDLPGDRSAESIIRFSRISRDIEDVIADNFEPSETAREWAPAADFIVIASERLESVIENSIEDPSVDSAIDIYNLREYRLEEADTVGFNVASEDVETEDVEEVEDEPVDEEPEEPEVVEEKPPSEEELLEERFPSVPVELRPYAREPDHLEIPAGKETKSVEPREMFDFEIELATPGTANTPISQIREGIGEAIAAQTFGVDEPAGTFPRTGIYIKYHLLHNGPAYILQMYNNLVVYTGYIRSIHGVDVKPGTYQSFREYIYRLEQVHKRDLGPQLIRPLDKSETSKMDIDTTPILPDGTEAPWLEDRQYYIIEEDGVDHPAWQDVVGFIYENEEQ